MKTWEMLKELTENPNKEFVSKNGVKVKMVDGRLIYPYYHDCELQTDDWFLVNEDVLRYYTWEDTEANAEHDIRLEKIRNELTEIKMMLSDVQGLYEIERVKSELQSLIHRLVGGF